MGEPTEISDDELAKLERSWAPVGGETVINEQRDIPRLVAALRSTRERLAAAEKVILDAWESGGCPGCGEEVDAGDEHDEACSWVVFDALAHPTTEEPTE